MKQIITVSSNIKHRTMLSLIYACGLRRSELLNLKPRDQYSPASLQKVLKQSVLKAGIRKPFTLHWLRHSYATHLPESGTNLRYIQELPGHKSPRTTGIYTHVSVSSIQKIRSPFDDL